MNKDEDRKPNIEENKREIVSSAAATLKAALKEKRLAGGAADDEGSRGSYEDDVDNIARHLGL